MAPNQLAKGRRSRGWQLLVAAALVGGVTYAGLAMRSGPAPEDPERLRGPARHEGYSRDLDFDDSGFIMAQMFVPPVSDPLSLESIRDCFQGLGYRGARALQGRLSGGLATPVQRLGLMVSIAQLYLYEGDWA